MDRTRLLMGLAAVIMAAAAVLAFGGIWLVTSRPMAVAEAIDRGSVTPVVQALSAMLGELWQALRQWL